ncbi:amidase [Cyanobium gracile UHCC 0139]|uniref:Amidase n=1 Tax=Cyanobium gracile UHCC 0139 TaxID=3110308 RepID=A0ABU5RXG1_9CYAN|nr:amidase [Cyanobium gracile]MEA5392470.1 amidase [Cyanobium gracile UHCC 0139]
MGIGTGLLLAGLVLPFPPAALAAAAPAPELAPPSCEARIRAVQAEILGRNLATGLGPPLNAFQQLNPYALEQAAAFDRARAAGAPAGPLDCLPLAVKDNFATADQPMAAGSLALLGNQPAADAEAVARLRAAGAIVVGTTTMDEFAFGIRGLSGAAGRVGNAYDPWLSPGGSSSGSAVAVAAGFVPLALGSDNCGSLRLPAVYNGAVTLRPTQGRFSSAGLLPLGFVNGTPGLIANGTGLLARGLAVLDPTWRPEQAVAPADLRGRRLAVLARAGDQDLAPTTEAAAVALRQAVALLRAAGAEVVEAMVVPGLDTRLGSDFVKGSGRRIDAQLARYPGSRRSWDDICGSGRLPPEWTPADCRSLMASDPAAEVRARRRMAANRRRLEQALVAQRLDGLLLLSDRRGGAQREPSPAITCMVSSTSGLPAVALPVAVDGRGLPVGLEILAASGRDEDLVAIAALLEARRGPLPAPRPVAPLASPLDLAGHNRLVPLLGWNAWRSRRDEALGDLEPARFRRLTRELLRRPGDGGKSEPVPNLAPPAPASP